MNYWLKLFLYINHEQKIVNSNLFGYLNIYAVNLTDKGWASYNAQLAKDSEGVVKVQGNTYLLYENMNNKPSELYGFSTFGSHSQQDEYDLKVMPGNMWVRCRFDRVTYNKQAVALNNKFMIANRGLSQLVRRARTEYKRSFA